MNKEDARAHYKRKRNALGPELISQYSREICSTAIDCLPASPSYIHCFAPIARLREVDTNPILEHIISSDHQLVMSISNFDDVSLEHFAVDSLSSLKQNKWGIPEPVGSPTVAVDALSLVFVPLLASDRHGQRVGYGKGFYDRFLSLLPVDCQIIGLSFFPPEIKIDGFDKRDVPLQSLITPEAIYRFD